VEQDASSLPGLILQTTDSSPFDLGMKKLLIHSPSELPKGQAKAILRGGTFHRVQVLLLQGQAYVEHCGLNYKVTRQKDSMGRIICTWSKS
jgi:hypothetical protein